MSGLIKKFPHLPIDWVNIIDSAAVSVILKESNPLYIVQIRADKNPILFLNVFQAYFVFRYNYLLLIFFYYFILICLMK